LVKQYTFRDKQQQQAINLDYEVEYRLWLHPAKAISIIETGAHEEAAICAYTDGSKYQGGVGSGVVIFKGSDIIARQKMELDDRCSNNQAEQVAIHKALEEIEVLNRERISPLTAIIYVYIYIYRTLRAGSPLIRFATRKIIHSSYRRLENK